MSGLPTVRAVMLMVAAVLAVTAVAGGVVVIMDGDLLSGVQEPVRGRSRATPQQSDAPRLDQLVPTTEPVKDFGAGGPGVTSTPARVLAIAPGTVPKETRLKLAKLKHVQKVTVVDAGAVKISGTGLNLLAVDPSGFRSWTPQPVADQPAVWSALARGELVAEAGALRKFGMVLGAMYQVDGGPRLRVAASAPLGLTGVDGLVSADVGRTLGFAPGVAVLLHGKEGRIGEAGVRKLLGKGAQVVVLDAAARAPKQQQPSQEQPQQVSVGRPSSYLELYKAAATRCPGLSWTVLAAIGQVESGHGRNNGPSSAGALGPMQFMPATWKHYGVDGDGDGKKDIWSPYDAVPGAANYLCANKAGQGGERLRKAIWFYNHSWDYVNKVMSIADAYAKTYA
ncbi:lytic transglycosylase domain-containing protein [Nonomuraea gerenzanensis]|uniref:Membrane-bound lytic murein transglycosylase B n=1 Tax=Nonomuraea gerenzanensis TaxID=93944 RepID=A0A1M4EKF3_9ACTN|nr:lytic transglycosylase domain-containing protein [Nonomuraea gerenzanensis]UBU10788.1 lytic transglycosylase domain-containing protein [Nonomuraea gerenzanensis]SBO99218.1 Membrane-bound lytic murein transglycosylase B precursor [Nonomuraea gerenzanensis]